FQGRNIPQFPSSIEWISNNQLSDDRLLINTLACVVALRYWNVHGDKSDQGISFIKENISKLGDASPEHMTCGFEVVFPAVFRVDALVIQDISDVRDQKMKRVPKELLHEVPTGLLHNLEGLGNLESLGKLEWPKILKLQTPKGSFITSPAATCYAIMETNDQDCIEFIQYIVKKFNGGAPTVYPVDIYARLWAVDRLERLGISRFFEPEIKNCLDHVYRYIKCALEIPWYASLPRLEARFYIENYGADDIWIGKSLYRMPEINKERYLELGKLDYNKCQAQHQMEWNHMQQIWSKQKLKELLLAFFVASSSIFETERYGERIAWVKTNILDTRFPHV
ncbi:hypothetical protein MIMGU_mgv1a024560mg, partial [Erythranthe guttata]